MDQKSGARSSKMTPNVSKLFSPPVISAGPIKRNTPPNPMTKPRMACQVGFDPPARMDSNNTSQKGDVEIIDRKSTRLNSSHGYISYAVFCLKKKKKKKK